MKKYGVIVGIVLVIVLIILIINLPKTNPTIPENNNTNELTELISKKLEHGELKEVAYSNSGDSNGNIDRIIIDINNLTLKTEYKANYSDPLEVKEYSFEKDDLKELLDYIEEYNFIVWSTLPLDRDNIALDAASKNITLYYDNSSLGIPDNYYSIDYNKKIPREGYPLLNNLVDKIYSMKNRATLVNEYSSLDEKK